jgi:hypothetical protein
MLKAKVRHCSKLQSLDILLTKRSASQLVTRVVLVSLLPVNSEIIKLKTNSILKLTQFVKIHFLKKRLF